LSGIAHDLQGYIDNAEMEATRTFGSPQSSKKLTELNKELRKACDAAWERVLSGKGGTDGVNRDPEVVRIVGQMHDMAFATKSLDQVANQPIVGLVIDYMAQLARYSQADPDHLTRRAEMSVQLDARIAELEAEEAEAEEAMARAEAEAERRNEMALAFPGDRYGPDPEDERERYLENIYWNEAEAAREANDS
jgi:hypothetical protein